VIPALTRRARFLRRRLERKTPKGARDPTSVSLDMGSDSRTLLLAFGGMQGRIGMPPFEFLRLTGEMPVKRLFVRDVRQAWYHRGTPDYGDTIESVADSLRALIRDHDVERLVTAGNSAGGYAALAFGTMLGADTVLSFAPQTTLDPAVLGEIGDHRWDEHLTPLVEAAAIDVQWADLASAMPRARRAATRYQVYFDDSLSVDRLHAERLLGLDGLRLYRFGSGRHHLVRALREAGALERILRTALHVPLRAPQLAGGEPGDGAGVGDDVS
jgi:pimeloyl-ACP methyl ester carboxylesterase